MNQNQQEEESDLKEIFMSDKLRSILSIISYCLLLFLTIFLGFGLYDKLNIEYILSDKNARKISIFLLIIVWVFLLVSEILSVL